MSGQPLPNLPHENPKKVPLSLATHLPNVRTFDLTSVQVHVGCTVDHVATLLHEGVRRLAPFPNSLSGHASTWVSERPHASSDSSPHTAKVIEIYTDGSFDGSYSSGAFHASGDWGEGFRSLGWIGDQVELGNESPLYLGAQIHGALQGELSALFWCLVWILPLSPAVPVNIYSDCISAIGVTEGSAGQFRGIDLAARCRHMMQAVKARTRDSHVAIQHVKSHVGHVGNETADYLAKACCRPVLRVPIWRDHPICLFLQRDWLTWLRQIAGSFEDPTHPEPPLPSPAECAAMLGLGGGVPQPVGAQKSPLRP